jgi:hypothetical protein
VVVDFSAKMSGMTIAVPGKETGRACRDNRPESIPAQRAQFRLEVRTVLCERPADGPWLTGSDQIFGAETNQPEDGNSSNSNNSQTEEHSLSPAWQIMLEHSGVAAVLQTQLP